MVAYTSPSCIPYFEGPEDICLNTGTVCDPSTVWCDMAAIIDAKLTEFDTIVSQSISSFPYAEVAITDLPQTLDSGGSSGLSQIIVWDAVLGDSDNIIELGADPSTFFLRRSGIWAVRCAVTWRSSFAQTQVYLTLTSAGTGKIPVPTFALFDRIWVEAVPDPGTIIGGSRGLTTVFDMFFGFDTSTGPAPISMSFNGFANAAFILTVEQAIMSVRWVAELP